MPQAEDFDDYLLNAELGVEAALNSHVNLRTVLQNRYDNTPGEGLEKNDLALITGIGVSLLESGIATPFVRSRRPCGGGRGLTLARGSRHAAPRPFAGAGARLRPDPAPRSEAPRLCAAVAGGPPGVSAAMPEKLQTFV